MNANIRTIDKAVRLFVPIVIAILFLMNQITGTTSVILISVALILVLQVLSVFVRFIYFLQYQPVKNKTCLKK